MAQPRSSARSYAPALALALASLVAVVALGAGPRTPRQVAAVFPPWWSSARIVAAAGQAGAITGFGGARNVVLVTAADTDLPRRLNAAGALLQLDPVLTGLCTPTLDAAHV